MIEIKEELLDIEGIKNSKKPLLDLFIRRTAVVTQTTEALTEKIIRDQWRYANKMMQANSSVSEIDFCNLGVLKLSLVKARKRIERLNKSINLYTELMATVDDKNKEKCKEHIFSYNEIINRIKLKTKQLSDENQH